MVSGPMTVRRLTDADLPAVAALEQACFAEPWSVESLRFLTAPGGVGRGVVCLCDGQIAAYGGMLCVAGEGQVTNIATFPSFRRRGLGRAVVQSLLALAREENCESVVLEVRASNLPAQCLYTACGFDVIGRRPHFYRMPAEDALLMQAQTGVGLCREDKQEEIKKDGML